MCESLLVKTSGRIGGDEKPVLVQNIVKNGEIRGLVLLSSMSDLISDDTMDEGPSDRLPVKTDDNKVNVRVATEATTFSGGSG